MHNNRVFWSTCWLLLPCMLLMLLHCLITIHGASSISKEVITVPAIVASDALADSALNDLLIVATLDGHLHGVRKSTGEIAWTVRDSEGKVNVLPRPKPTDKKLFLPDPRDGSLYFFDMDTGIRKLPMSIPELVRAAPSRSADGLFYTGRKHASWIAVNPITGSKWELQGEGADDASCPLTDRSSILIPKIEYVLSLFDMNSKITWNATYRHYGAWTRIQPELNPFDSSLEPGSFLLSSTSSGHLAKMNGVEKKLKWCSKFESPVASIFSPSTSSGNLRHYTYYAIPDESMQYVLNKDFRRLSRMLSLPLWAPPSTHVSATGKNNNKPPRTLNTLKNYLHYPRGGKRADDGNSLKIHEKLKNNMALYVGHFNNEMYAMPSLSDNIITPPTEKATQGGNTASSLPPDGMTITLPSDDDDADEFQTEGQETGLISINDGEPSSCYIPAIQVHDAAAAAKKLPLLAGPSAEQPSKTDALLSRPDEDDDVSVSDSIEYAVDEPPQDVKKTENAENASASAQPYIVNEQQRASDNSCIADGPLGALFGLHWIPRDDSYQTSDSDFGSNIEWHNIAHHKTPAPQGDSFWYNSVLYGNFISMLGAVVLGLLLVAIPAYFGLFFISGGTLVRSSGSSSGSGRLVVADTNNNNGSRHSVDKIVVGNKMEYYPNKLLGRGCDGTCVFKGRFDNRDVAVKRLLPDCFRLADREVATMKHADMHPNVIRYYCTEADSQFRYIALELCNATLADYVDGKTEFKLDMKFVLLQAMNGLKHLHSLDIVHRDVKPRNVLLAHAVNVGLGVSHAGMHNVGDDAQRSATAAAGRVRVLISDFGLCKQVAPGRVSLTKHTGLIGTEGWIAPELVLAQRAGQTAHVSKSMDIFSAGCLFYYCLSGGAHPYGEEFSRQVNIVQGVYSLKALDEQSTTNQETFLAVHLIEQMIQHDPSMRPTAAGVMSHPYFWTKGRRLAFLQDVSDRIEKADARSAVIRALENNHRSVVERDWIRQIGVELQRDLQSHRTYNRGSVRDLLRAIRNKKHHYSELSEAVREELGELTDAFLDYFTGRFPRLFMHVYLAMQLVRAQDVHNIGAYYSPECKWMPLRVPAENWRQTMDDDDFDEVDNNNNNNSGAGDRLSPPIFGSSPVRNNNNNKRRSPLLQARPQNGSSFGLPPWHQNGTTSTSPPVITTKPLLTVTANTAVQEQAEIDDDGTYIHEYIPNGQLNNYNTNALNADAPKVSDLLQKILLKHAAKPAGDRGDGKRKPLIVSSKAEIIVDDHSPLVTPPARPAMSDAHLAESPAAVENI